MKYRQDDRSKPIPVLLDQALRDRIETISKKLGEPKSTVMRMAMRIGLEGLEKAFAGDPKLSSLSYPSKPDQGVEFNEGEGKKRKAG